MSTQSLSFERLKGRENFSEWKVGARAWLTAKGHWTYVSSDLPSDATEGIKTLNQKALAELTLLLDPSIYSHIADIDEAKKAWEALLKVFEDSGALRKVSLFKQWISLQLSNCTSMQDYVNKSVTLRGKVKAAGFEISEDIAGSILLCGLSDDYKPLIMSVETKDSLTLDYVKNLLLQGVEMGECSESALIVKKQKNNNGKKGKKPVKCYDCGGPHYKNKCTKGKSNEHSECVLFCAATGHDEKIQPVTTEEVFDNAMIATDKSKKWYVDSGATRHMTHMEVNLDNLRESGIREVKVANNETMKIKRIGDMKCQIGAESRNIVLKEVHQIPELFVNLLSVNQMVIKGNTVVFDSDGVRIYSKNKDIIASGKLIDGMFELNVNLNEHEHAHVASEIKSAEPGLWHRRLAHVNNATLKSVLNIKVKQDTQCVVCSKGKHARKPFKETGTRANKPLEIVHSDVCGPMSVNSLGGHRYYVSFIDDFTRKVFVYIMTSKNEVFAKFLAFKSRVENETECKIKILRTDNGTEYVNNRFKQFFEANGIKHEYSAPYSPQQNGLSERMNRTIVEKARCMLIDAKLERFFWAEAVLAAVNIINALPNASTKTAPDEMWYNKKCDLNNFRVFGCKAMVWQPEQKRKKFDNKSFECIFLRYADNAKAYRLYDLNTKKIIISRDVIFMEVSNTSNNDVSNSQSDNIILYDDINENNENGKEMVNETIASGRDNLNESTVSQQTGSASQLNANSHGVADRDVVDLNESTDDVGALNTSGEDPTFRTRARIDENARRPATRSTRDPDEDLLLGLHVALIAGEPQNYQQALNDKNSEKWKAAMKDEYTSLIKNNTWELVDRPKNTKLVDNKWVFKIKEAGNDSSKIFRARLVARGFTQEYGINYNETFSPVVRFTSIRSIIAIAAQKRMSMKQFDVRTAFLNGELNEVVYMEQPIGFEDKSKRVCKLKKSLYGLKQSSRCWNEKFTKSIKLFGFTQCKSDPCVFVSRKDEKLTILAIHVDDGLIVGEDMEYVEATMKHLGEAFEMKEMDVGCFLGLQIQQNENKSIFIHQTSYAKKVLEKFNMSACNTVSMPSDPNQTLYSLDDSEVSSYPYRELIGSLMYLAIGTRADIAYAVGVASRFMEKPTVMHERAVKRILKYLKNTLTFGILFSSDKNNNLYAYSDADYAGDIDTRRSTSGSVFMYASGAISWNSARQKSVSASTTESEYIAASLCVRELTWVKQLFTEIFNSDALKVKLYMDNQSAIRLIKNPEFHKRTKHIDVAYHMIREKYEQQLFCLEYISTKEMLADIFTKSLPSPTFKYLTTKLGIVSNSEQQIC